MSQSVKINNKGKGRHFQNPVLEAVTKTSPAIVLGFYIPVISAFLFWNFYQGYEPNVAKVVGLFLLGFLSWTFFEYVMHRYVFHFVNDNPMVQKFHKISHGVHHEFPRDKDKLFMPPIAALFIIAFYWLIFSLLIGNTVYSFLPGFVFGYLVYSMIHYAMHRVRPPKSLKFLWKHHSLHHYKYPNLAFGVSTPIWDWVFGTLPPKTER